MLSLRILAYFNETSGLKSGSNGFVKYGFLVWTGAILSSVAFAQQPGDIPINDLEGRNYINEALPSLLQMDPTIGLIRSYALRMDTVVTTGTREEHYSTYLSVFDDQADATETLQAELLCYQVNPSNGNLTLKQRIAADGWRVWAYNPAQNEYSVSFYSNDRGGRPQNYRKDFINLFKTPVKGHPANLLTLMNQLSTGINPLLKDWISGLRFQGWDRPSNNTRTIWQATPNNDRTATFFLAQINGVWQVQRIEVNRQDQIGTQIQSVRCTLTQVVDSLGLPLRMNRNEPRFFFSPPAGSKVIASPRTIIF